tara:strand:+ start:1819 stop:3624 length:1806 start_codon:yes stop_codon:yes gene_type:complete
MNTFRICLLLVPLVLSACFDNSGSSHTADSNSDASEHDENQTEDSSSPDSSSDNNQQETTNPVATNLAYGTLTDITRDVSESPTPYIPPQCYTNPVKENGEVSNPCYACHGESKRPNYLNDTDVQEAYAFPESGVVNRWANIRKDRTNDIAAISDDDILRYVREDNYRADNGGIILAAKLANPPAEWDRNGDGKWEGYSPDAWFDFNEQGFDIAPDGQYSGWRVYAYYPFLGTFMPTNGSTDDVMIRLPEAFQQLTTGTFDLETYKINLAIVEALLKEQDVMIDATDETRFGVDLDNNGVLGTTTQITYDWAPNDGRYMTYVGVAKSQLEKGDIHLAARLFPEGTEFLHSVRYLDINEATGNTGMAARMKELRYSRKMGWRTYYDLREIVNKEIKERHDFPSRTKTIFGNMEVGVYASHGWLYQGFIEDDAGQLRPQTYEENAFCLGCHGFIGAHNDTVLSFERKFDTQNSFRQGWYHWLEKGFSGVADLKREDGAGEFAYYLAHNPTGNEFRTNDEVLAKFFDSEGNPVAAEFAKISDDISYLLMPSAERALKLNKAYRVIVKEQSFNLGREAVITPLTNVYDEVEVDQKTGITEILSHY